MLNKTDNSIKIVQWITPSTIYWMQFDLYRDFKTAKKVVRRLKRIDGYNARIVV